MGDGNSERKDVKQPALKQPGVTDLRACCPDDDSPEDFIELMRGKWKETIDSLDIGDFLKPFRAEDLLRHPAYEFNQEANLKIKLDPSTLLKTSPYYSRIEIFPYDPLIDGDDPDNIRYEEVFFSDDEDAMASQDICQPGDIRKYVRGSMNSVPFQPGGENWVKPEVSKASMRVLEEAMSLKWVEEWESGNLPDIEVPGYAEYVASMDFVDQGPTVVEAMGTQGESEAGKQEEEVVINISNILDGILPLGESESEAEEDENKQEESPEKEVGVDHGPPGKEEGELSKDGAHEEDDASSLLEKVLEGDLSVEKALVGTHSKRVEEVWAVREPIPDLEMKWRELKPKLARKYPFELDTFQKEAIWHMENDDCVFVAAHTSAGKTVAAEYAFALSESHCTRAVYTSPIKTISNQKFRDFSGQFEVGILTGDVSIRPESSCLIMTTEILRSMLYKGADIIRDIEWVIFDEVHYVNDAERGVVWEEVIIMLPDHIKLLMLSATVPNVLEFANWVGKTKQKKVYVCGTNKRPVPLEHTLYYGGKFFTICTHEKYDPTGWKKAKEEHAKKSGAPKTKAEAKAALPTGRGPPKQGKPVQPIAPQYKTAEMKLKSERSQWGSLIEKFKKQSLLPMVAFCFSKRRCDALADSLRSLDLTSGSEKSEIHLFCDKAFSRLHASDRNLPQLKRIKEMLKRGLGIHHAGLLPIVKEVVEMLFCRGVIKVLFATETFAMGVNAPARAVVFQSIRKHDGRSFRNLLPGEYTQMAGRAGRRGLDSVGTVVIACWEEPPSEIEIKKMLTGSATKLESQFRLTYNMILNLLRVEDLKVEDMLKRSFAEFHAQRCAPDEQKTIMAGQNALVKLQEKPWPVSSMSTTKEEVQHYVDISLRAERLGSQIQEDVMLSRGAMNALTNGRIVLIEKKNTGLVDLGVILKPSGAEGKGKKKSKLVQLKSNDDSSTTRTILRLLTDSPLDHFSRVEMKSEAPSQTLKNSDPFVGMKAIGGKSDNLDDMFAGMRLAGSRKQGPSESVMKLPHEGDIGGTRYEINEIDVREIFAISSLKIDVDSEKILQGNNGKIAVCVQELHRLSGESLNLMDPISDMKVNRIDIVSSIRERQMILNEMMSMPVHRDPLLPEMVALVRSEAILTSRLKQLMRKTGEAGLSQLPEFHQRIKVLQKMGYVRSDKTISLKGRVACEINSGSELVGTEMIFGGLLADLTPEEAVALLSGLVFQDKTDVDSFDVPDSLMDAYERALALAWNAGEEQAAVGLNILPDEFVKETLNFGLMSVVYHWACGKPFAEICEMTDVMEGSIVRCIVRLDETCREFRDAARVMGDMNLSQQMDEASEAIKRDIVFAASLYIV